MTQILPTKIKFDWDTMQFEGLTMSQIEVWESLYPDISIADELREMIQWLDKMKGTKKAKKTSWKRFIVNWFARAQKKAVL